MFTTALRIAALLACVPAGCTKTQEPVLCDTGAQETYYGTGLSWVEYYCGTEAKVAHGWYRFEEPQGTVLESGRFDMGRADGPWTEWHPGGEMVAQESSYVLGVPDGTWTGWDEKGNKRWEHSWDMAEACGVWTDWDEWGEVVSSTTYRDCDGSGAGPVPDPPDPPNSALRRQHRVARERRAGRPG